jgi:predicted DNA-binding protein
MMTTTLETPQSMKSREHLEKLFHVLMTPTMYTQIENHSAHLSISKGALIRSAVETYLSKVEAEQS